MSEILQVLSGTLAMPLKRWCFSPVLADWPRGDRITSNRVRKEYFLRGIEWRPFSAGYSRVAHPHSRQLGGERDQFRLDRIRVGGRGLGAGRKVQGLTRGCAGAPARV